MNCKEIHSNLDNYSYSENKKLAEVYSIWITEFKQWISIKITLLLSDTISANSDTIIFTFAGSDTSSMRSLWNMHTLFFHERMQPWNVSLPWQRKQKWRPDDWSQFKMLSFPSPVVNQVLENLWKIHLHLKNIVLDLRDGALENWEADLHRALLTTQPFLLFEADRAWGSHFPAAFSLSSTTVGFVIRTKGTIIPTSKCIYKYSVCWCNWHKTQTAPWVPNFSFYTSTFQITTSRITRNSSKFLALGVPMIPAGTQKRLSFSPLKIMYFPGTIQMPQMRQVKDLFWPTFEKPFRSQLGPRDLVIIYAKCPCLNDFNIS